MKPHRYITFVLLLAFVGFPAACGGGGGDGGGTFGLGDNRVVVQGLQFPLDVPVPTPLNVTRAFPNLSFGNAVFVAEIPDGRGRLVVGNLDGVIYIFDGTDDATASRTVFLDLSSVVSRGSGEEGLLGFAFDPDYANNGRFFVYHSRNNGGRETVLARFNVSAGDPDVADAGSRLDLFRESQDFSNHNGGTVAFGPDGMLYLSLGDGGSGNDPRDRAQDRTRLLGSILRIDVDGSAYTIPTDNPFFGEGNGVREEIWAFGLRHPWRFSFDRDTGALWCGDVGQGAREEVSIVERGDNCGWPMYEGTIENRNPQNFPFSDFKGPVVEHGRSLGNAVIGGYVYRGSQLDNLRGAYLYGDNGSGIIWALVTDANDNVVSNEQVATLGQLTSFGELANGELLACSFRSGGSLWRFSETGGGPPRDFPDLLSDTGLFTDLANLTPAPGLIEYGVNAPFWSDGAVKRRWIGLPGNQSITFRSTGAWDFPIGTILVKHFELDLNPAVRRRVETRVLIRFSSGWEGYVYQWNDAQTDADLLDGSDTDVFTIEDASAPGGQRDQTWNYPSRSACLQCHTEAAGRVLGIRTRQLNRDFDYGSVTDNQLRAWNHVGMFTTNIGSSFVYDAYVSPADESAPSPERARTYLAVNCAQCHLPGGPAPGSIDMRFDTALGAMNLVTIPPTEGDLGIAGALRIFPGVKESSVLWERVRRTDGTGMPPIAHNLVDPLGVDLLGSWIDSGPQ